MTGESNSVIRLCVAVRRKLQLYYGKNGEFKQHLFDYTIPDVPKVMAWGQEYLCVGFKGEYTLYDVRFVLYTCLVFCFFKLSPCILLPFYMGSYLY